LAIHRADSMSARKNYQRRRPDRDFAIPPRADKGLSKVSKVAQSEHVQSQMQA
jgi:hypothetical protein